MMAPSVLLLLVGLVSMCTPAAPGKVCGRPALPSELDTAALQRVYEVGEELSLFCRLGYTPFEGSRKIFCTAKGEWTPPTLKCQPKKCPVPGSLYNGKIHAPDIRYKSVINYTCNDGHILIGDDNSTCLQTGVWSNPMPFCKPVTCSLPEIPNHGKITHHKEFTGNTTLFGDRVKYECMPPYALFGNEFGSCTANGTWTEMPVCRFVTCPVPKSIKNGFISFSVMREHSYKETVKYGCNVDHILDGSVQVQCEKTGNWSTLPVCRAPCPVEIERSRIFYNGKKLWVKDLNPNRILHGEMLAVYCKNEERKCGYPVAIQCIDGTLKLPDCFKQPSRTEYHLHYKSLPSEITMC